MQVCTVKRAVLEYGLETGFNKEYYIVKYKKNSQNDIKITKFLFRN